MVDHADKLGALIERGVDQFSYTYDFVDNWQRSITIETVAAADPTIDYPRFIEGARRAPPEDVGGRTKETGNDAALRAAKNTLLGETWEQRGEAPDWQHLSGRRED